ncbi:MAG: hypothetical protein AAF799_07155 [Myxococcota bacterium]
MNIDRARLFDKRVVQRNVRAGRVTKEEYQAWLGELADTSEKILPRDEGGDDDGYEVMPPKPAEDATAEGAVPGAPDVAAPADPGAYQAAPTPAYQADPIQQAAPVGQAAPAAPVQATPAVTQAAPVTQNPGVIPTPGDNNNNG